MKKSLIYTLLAVALLLPAVAQAVSPQRNIRKQPVKMKKELCLQLYSVRSLLNGVNADGKASADWTALLKRLHNMGYTSVEAANYDNGKGTFYNRKPKDFKADVEGAGMKMLSSHVSHNLSDAELASGDYSEALKWWKKTIADHKAAGIPFIVDPWIGKQKSLHDLDVYCRYLNAVGEMCRKEGISFGYHNHDYEFAKVEGQVMYDYMLTHTNPENVFFQDADRYIADGNYVVTWAFNWTPAVDDWRAAVVDALTQYTAGTGDWEAVKTAFVQGWATQYAKENA